MIEDALATVVVELGGEERPGQVAMARAVTDSLAGGQHLLVEAGTGTGKSLGYLVPALLHARSSGRRVVVSTSTLALQRQIVDRDLPAISQALAGVIDPVPRHAVLKGRSNYACLHRVREGVPDDQGALVDLPAGGLGAEVVALREWADGEVEAQGEGDRDHAPSHTDRAWRQVSVSARECLGANVCPFADECFAERAKVRAADADLVVTNHALLAIHTVGQVPALPEFDAVVIDEAHDLAARVTQSATNHLEASAIQRAARRAATHLESRDLADDLAMTAEDLNQVLAATAPGRIEAPSEALRAALIAVRDTARAAISDLTSGEDESTDAALVNVKASLDDLRLTADRMIAMASTDVVWVGESRAGAALSVAPINVADELGEHLFGETTCILTSATLQVGGNFAPVARSVGLIDDDSWRGLDVGSPFDYAKQGMLYAAQHLPPPGRDGLTIDHLGEITKLVKAAGGRTLGLFSSRRAAETAAEYVRESLPEFEVLCQGDAHLSELTERFIENPRTSLFGTLGLWQGLDLPGDTCTLVIIDRIPFPRPDDPIMSARSRRVAERGGNGFMQVAAQHAALLLAQGAGRLIRRSTDRGVVAILDPRLVTARYGGFLAASLPPLWRTTDPAVVTAALHRLDENSSLG